MNESIENNLAIDLARRADEVPDRVGLHYEDGRAWTYREWNDLAARYAAALSSIGIEQGSRVALFCQNSPELTFLMFGCWRIGAVPVAVSSLYNADELRGCLRKTTPARVITDAGRADVALAVDDAAIVVGTEPGDPHALVVPARLDGAELPLVAVAPDAEAGILFTGGTTGEPKAVTVTGGGVRTALATLARASKGGRPGPYEAAPEAASPNMLAWPLFHSGGQQALLFALHVGRSLALLERFRPQTLADVSNRHQIDNLFLLPTMVFDLLHADPPVQLDSVRTILIAGQAIDPGLKSDFEEHFNIPILSNYGSTEMGHVAGWTAKDVRENRWIPGSAGRIYDGVDVEVRDADGSPVEAGTAGTIWVRSDLSTGYVGDDGTADLLVDGWVNSGDVGHIDDGVLYLAGRERDMIKSSGYQIWPAEIERELRQHPIVADIAVVGVADLRRGEVPKAFVVPTRDVSDDADEQERSLIEFCRERLAHFKQIRAVEFIDALPRSDAGKVQRAALVREQAHQA